MTRTQNKRRISLSRKRSREHHQEFPRGAEESCSENVATINPAFRRRISAGTSSCSLSRSITIVAEPHNLITAEVRRHPLSRSRLTSSADWGGKPVSKSHPGHTFVSFDGHSAHRETYRGYDTCRHVCLPVPFSILLLLIHNICIYINLDRRNFEKRRLINFKFHINSNGLMVKQVAFALSIYRKK